MDRLMQVMANLLSNAVKFSPEGDAVRASIVRREGLLRVAVTDRGPGVPEAFRNNLFKKFAQADSSDSRQRGGTGLGLRICKLIVEHLGGEIGFASQPHSETSFYFELPELRQESRLSGMAALGATGALAHDGG
jgi:signal transduction histidine kinase